MSTTEFDSSRLRFASVRVRAVHVLALLLASLLLPCYRVAHSQANYLIPGTTPVGTSTSVVLPVTLKQAGTVSTLLPLTTGNAGGDFSIVSGGTCAVGQAYAAGAQCTVSVGFTPSYPGLRRGAVVAKDSSGAILGTALVSGQGTGGLPMFTPGTAQTFAGEHDAWFYVSDGVAATSAPINLPSGVVLDFNGNMYLADTLNNRIRRVDAQTGLISTVAGTGLPGFSGDGGAATNAMINSPASLAMDGAGNLFFADQRNHVIRRLDAASQVITTVAGTGQVRGYSGDNGPATSAQLNLPLGVSFDQQGNLLIADTYNHVIRIVDAVSGTIRTLAGTGTSGFNGDNQLASSAQLSIPALALSLQDGSILVADTGNNRVRRIDRSGVMTTLAGNGAGQFAGDGGAATAASLKNPSGLATDPAGNIYIADSSNNRIRMVAADTRQIVTIMGTDSGSFSGDNAPANVASLYNPNALFFAQNGTLYISDSYNQSIRGIVTDLLKLTYSTIRRGKVSPPQLVTLANRGNASLTLSSFAFNMSAVDSITTSCSQARPLTSLQTCQLGVEFAPTVIGRDVVGSLGLPSDVTHITPTVRLDGEVLDVNPTTVTVVSSKNPSMTGDAVTFTASVTSDDANRTGNVTLTSDGTALCTSALQADGSITCTASNLSLESHAIVAQYAGDAQNAAATSATLTQVVKQPTTLQLTSSSNPATVTNPVTFTVTASAATGVPVGTVTFLDGTTTLGTAVLASGRASLTTSSLAPGAHSILAQYGGDASDATGQSTVLAQEIQQSSTTTLLGASNSSPPVGTAVTFTATVSSTIGSVPSGSVQFRDGSTVLATASLSATGSASFSTSSLTAGSHAIVAVYSGDTNDATSSSASLALTVQQLATATTAQPGSNPLSAGATEHLSAAVGIASGSTAQGPITGTVTFREGSTTYDSVALDDAQHAATDLRNLSVGTHVISMVYGGNANYAASSTTVTVTVNQTAASISLSDAAGTTLAGGAAVWTAGVSSNTGIPTGTVIFRDGSTTLGSGSLDAHGVATFSTASLTVGSHTVTAVYGGDANYTSVTSAPVIHTVNRAVPTLTLTGPASNTVNVTANVTFSLTLSHPGSTPTGTLSLLDGATVIATQPVTAAGVASFNTASLALGQHSISASYSGDDANESANSTTIVVTVQKAPTVTTLVSSANPITLGSAVALTATVTASTPNLSGTVNFLDGQQVIGSAVLTNGVAALTTSQLSFGHHQLSAAYVGSDIHAASNSATLDQNVRQQAVVAVASSLNPSNSGQAVMFTATAQSVGGLLPTGTLIFTDGAMLGVSKLDASGVATLQISTLGVGAHTIAVSYGGDDNFSSAQASLSQTVNNSTSTTVETVSANPATYGTALTLTATVTTNGGVATGQVLFTENGTAVGSAALGGTGVALFTTASLAPGRHTVVATYQTDGRTSASASSPVTFLVQQQTSLAVNFDNNPTLTLTPVLVTAVLTNSNAAPATGNVQFFDGNSSVGSAPLVNGSATLTVPVLTAGTHAITAKYAGDDANYAANSPVVDEVVKLRATTTSLTSSATNAADSQQVTLIAIVQSPTLAATGVPTGSITFSQGGKVIGTAPINTAGLATLNQQLEVGAKETVTAAYSGDANYATSSSASTDVQSGAPVNFTIATDVSNVQLSSGQHQMLMVTLTSIKGFNDDIRLGCIGLPYAATCTFSKTSIALAANGTQTMQLMVDTGDPLGQGSAATASNCGNGMPTVPLICVLPGGVLLLLYRRRSLVPVLSACVLSVLLLGASGCSGLRMSSTPAGTYAFQVTGVGTGTGAKQTQTVTLVVGQ